MQQPRVYGMGRGKLREPPALRGLVDDVRVRRSSAFAVIVVSLTLAGGCAAVRKPAPEPANTPAAHPAYSALGGGHFIRAVNDDGRYVTLEDGSMWEIEPSVRFQTVDWQLQAAVTVRRATADGPFTYELDNTQDDEGALARYVPPR
jgi:hypothetical protein